MLKTFFTEFYLYIDGQKEGFREAGLVQNSIDNTAHLLVGKYFSNLSHLYTTGNMDECLFGIKHSQPIS